MKTKTQLTKISYPHNGEFKPSDWPDSPAPESSLTEALADAYDLIVGSCPKNHDEEQVKAAAKWALHCLQQSARLAKTPGLRSGVLWMENGFRDIGKAAVPNP